MANFEIFALLLLIETAAAFDRRHDNIVFLGYDFEKEGCVDYLVGGSKLTQTRARRLDALRDSKALRDLLLPAIAQYMVQSSNSQRERGLQAEDALPSAVLVTQTTNPLYETVNILSAFASAAHADVSKTIPSATWLKFVEMDKLRLPLERNPKEFSNNVRAAIPCIAFAEIPIQQQPGDILRGRTEPKLPAHSVSTRKLTTTNSVEASVPPLSATPKGERPSWNLFEKIPNDPLFPEQWNLNAISAPSAWKVWKNDKPYAVPIGIIDMGCDVNHPDLRTSYWKNAGEICDNGIDDDNNGYIDDCYGFNFYAHSNNLTDLRSHGTASVSIMAAATNNHVGIAGMCWFCRVICARIGEGGMHMDAFAEAINYFLALNVKVITYSGVGPQTAIQNNAIKAADKHDVTLVTIAGNAECDLDSQDECVRNSYPGTLPYKTIINVAASASTNKLAPYSSYGKTKVHIAAPSGVLGATCNHDGYDTYTGTSFSAPAVAVSLVYLWSCYPTLNASMVRESLLSGATPFSLSKRNIGGGLLNISKSLQLAYEMSRPPS